VPGFRCQINVMNIDGIAVPEFSTPMPISHLWETRYSIVPYEHGVYLVRRFTTTKPEFLARSGAGWFKGEDPSYPLSVVEQNWVPHASIVYVGKAGGSKGLRQRVRQLIDFAYGKPIGHRGGRMLWHLSDWSSLQLQWTICQKGSEDMIESEVISRFRQKYGNRPFANMSK
jgi:hypothetical protein